MQMHTQGFLPALALILSLSALPTLAIGQSSGPSKSSHVTIDGSVHPELISDDQALRVWLTAASGIADSSPDRVRRTQAMISAVGLNPDDSVALLTRVNQYGDGRRKLMSEAALVTDPSSFDGKQKLIQISNRSTLLFQAIEKQIYADLSPEGKQQLAKHLLHVKQHMKIGSGLQMH